MKRLALLVLAATPAFAQEPPPDETAPPPPTETAPPPPMESAPPPPPPPPPDGGGDVRALPTERTPGPILPNMLPTRIGATVDVRLDYTAFGGDDDLFGELFLMNLNLYGSYITPQGYGGYVQLPYWYASTSEGETDFSENGVGNLELGGLYSMKQGGASEVLLRGGIALDTAGSIGDFIGPISAFGSRLYDAYPIGFASTWGRVEGSFRHTEGNIHLGASVGGDVPITSSDEEDGISINLDAIAKAALSAGIDTGGAMIGIGFIAMMAIAEGDDETIFGFNASLAVPISPTTSLYGAFGLPDLENNADEFDIWGVGVGVRIAAQ